MMNPFMGGLDFLCMPGQTYNMMDPLLFPPRKSVQWNDDVNVRIVLREKSSIDDADEGREVVDKIVKLEKSIQPLLSTYDANDSSKDSGKRESCLKISKNPDDVLEVSATKRIISLSDSNLDVYQKRLTSKKAFVFVNRESSFIEKIDSTIEMYAKEKERRSEYRTKHNLVS